MRIISERWGTQNSSTQAGDDVVADWGERVDSNLFPDSMVLRAVQANGTDRHSLAGDPAFVDAGHGNYTVKGSSLALAIGFVNFSMTEFGVRKPALRRIALQPSLPALTTMAAASGETTIAFEGSLLKPVEGLGDRSVYGLPDEQGLIVVSVGKGSLLERSGLRDKDVIRSVSGKVITSVAQLRGLMESGRGGAALAATVIREQRLVVISLLTK